MTRTTSAPTAAAPEEIPPREMFRAFGMPRSTFMRALDIESEAPIPRARGAAGASRQRRWTRAQLPEIVAALRARGRPVPPGWDQTKTRG